MIRDPSIRSSPPIYRVCVPLCLSLVLISVSISQAQSIPPPALASEAHIFVHVTSAYGDPAGDLRPEDFHVMAGNAPVSFEVSRPPVDARVTPDPVPTRLLIVLSYPESRQNLNRLADKLKPLWKNAWQISVLNAGAKQTPYAIADPDLRHALMGGAGHQATISDAADDLRHFTGRRVMIAVTAPKTPVNSDVVRAAARAGAMLYHVGADPSRLPMPVYGPSNDFTEFSSTGGIVASVETPGAPSFPGRLIHGGVIEERTLNDARNDSLHDGLGFYDLKLSLPPTSPSLTLGVDIYDTNKGRYQVHAYAYAEGRTPPQLTLAPDTLPAQHGHKH